MIRLHSSDILKLLHPTQHHNFTSGIHCKFSSWCILTKVRCILILSVLTSERESKSTSRRRSIWQYTPTEVYIISVHIRSVLWVTYGRSLQLNPLNPSHPTPWKSTQRPSSNENSRAKQNGRSASISNVNSVPGFKQFCIAELTQISGKLDVFLILVPEVAPLPNLLAIHNLWGPQTCKSKLLLIRLHKTQIARGKEQCTDTVRIGSVIRQSKRPTAKNMYWNILKSSSIKPQTVQTVQTVILFSPDEWCQFGIYGIRTRWWQKGVSTFPYSAECGRVSTPPIITVNVKAPQRQA